MQRAWSLHIAPDDVVHGCPVGMVGTSRDRVIVGRGVDAGRESRARVMSCGLVRGQVDHIDVRIELLFSGLDPPEGEAACLAAGDGRRGVERQAFVGWLGLLGVLQMLIDERVEPPRS